MIKEVMELNIEEHLKSNNFDILMYRLILEHNSDYIDNCYFKGLDPYPNKELFLVLEYIKEHGIIKNIKYLNSKLPNKIWEFENYYFQEIYESEKTKTLKIYNAFDDKLLLKL